MAPVGDPFSTFLAGLQSVRGDLLMKRQADAHESELVSLMCISLSMAAISVVAALYAFYWFVRMRRSFRQDLIMLLIQSDMMKALWLVICPLAYFANVPLDSNSAFCQVSGFFLTVAIQASDIAVLLIATHTALFILKPQRSGGATGLHPYRRIAYILWAVVPIVLAAVVPITGGRFEDNGPYCYFPIKPTWYLRALSWIPRYVIFAIITVTYSGLYLYIGLRFYRFGKDQRRASTFSSNGSQRRKQKRRSREIPPTPPIADHGLLDSMQGSVVKPEEQENRQDSVVSAVSTLQLDVPASTPKPTEQVRRSSITWNLVNFGHDGAAPSPNVRPQVDTDPVSPSSRSFEIETSSIRAPEPVHHSPKSSGQTSTHSHFLFMRPLSLGAQSLANSVSNIMTALRRGPPEQPDTDAATGSSSSVHLPQEETEEMMRRSREKMQRQLRLLFVYPLIYMVTWVAPFVSHVLKFDDDYGDENAEPFALRVVSLASLCIGAAVDCCFFSAWERPWLHLRGGFWEGLALRLRIRSRTQRRGGGRTKEERTKDARMAQVRWEQENREYLTEAAVARTRPQQQQQQQRRRPREWWEVVDVDTDVACTARLV